MSKRKYMLLLFVLSITVTYAGMLSFFKNIKISSLFPLYHPKYCLEKKVIFVSPEGSIQDAIDSVLPGEETVIQLSPGIYTEMINIHNYAGSRDITIKGEKGPLKTIIEMDPLGDDTVVEVHNCYDDEIKIEGVTLRYGKGGNVSVGDEVCRGGGGLFIMSSNVEVKNCILTENSVDGYGGALYAYNSTVNLDNVTIFDNETTDPDGDGGGIFLDNTTSLNIHNSIIFDNLPNDVSSLNAPEQSIDISYSLINSIDNQMTGLSMNQCISGDPLVCNYADDDINLNGCIMEGSPCIDTGDIFVLDFDGTRSDMGAVASCFDVKTCEGNHWNWESFPRVGDVISDISDQISNVLDMEDLYPISNSQLMKISANESVILSQFYSSWDPEVTLFSAPGYKIKRYSYDDFYIPLEGYRLSNTYQFTIYSNQDKWLGYWIPETRNIEDALNGLWDYVNTIEAEDWFYQKPVGGFSTPSSSTLGKNLEYGKMYIFNINASTTWTWDPPGGGGGSSSTERIKPKFFVFADQPDYLAIDILDIDDDVEEIGVFQGSSCIGASVVDSSSVQVLAYIDPELRNSPELSLQFVCNNRERGVIEECWVYNTSSNEFKKNKLEINLAGYLLLSLKDGYPLENNDVPGCYLYQNHPNPFNPETTIDFFLAENTTKASLKIYNVKGQVVRCFDLHGLSGNCSITWNGKSSSGSFVSSGLYFYKLEGNTGSISRKMILMK